VPLKGAHARFKGSDLDQAIAGYEIMLIPDAMTGKPARGD